MKKFVLLCLSAALLAACNNQPAGTDATGIEDAATAMEQEAPAAAEPAAEEVAVAPPPAGPITFNPASVSNCFQSHVVDIAWDFSADPSIKKVKVYVVGKEGAELLYGHTGPRGQKQSGRWGRSGLTVIARDPDTGAEITRAVLPGPTCP